MVEEVDDTIFKVADFELEAVDLARVLHKGFAFQICEHVIFWVWFRCHRVGKNSDLRLC